MYINFSRVIIYIIIYLKSVTGTRLVKKKARPVRTYDCPVRPFIVQMGLSLWLLKTSLDSSRSALVRMAWKRKKKIELPLYEGRILVKILSETVTWGLQPENIKYAAVKLLDPWFVMVKLTLSMPLHFLKHPCSCYCWPNSVSTSMTGL